VSRSVGCVGQAAHVRHDKASLPWQLCGIPSFSCGLLVTLGLQVMTNRSIASVCKEVLIITYKENTLPLVQALTAEGFQCRNVSGPYTKEEETYSSVVQCFVNHKNAWLYAADSGYPVIIVEPDFVPVRGFGQLPLPFPWHEGSHEPRMAWLYSAGSILYGIDK